MLQEIETSNWAEERFPIAVPVRRISIELEEKVDKKVENLMAKNIILEIEYTYNAPLVCITNENGYIGWLSATKCGNVQTDVPDTRSTTTFQFFGRSKSLQCFRPIPWLL